MMTFTKWIGAFCLSAMIASPALAQTATERATGQSTVGRERQTPGTPGTAGASGRTGAGQTASAASGENLDQKIAVCLLLGNQEEVAMAQFAEQRSQNDQVKQFAQQMIQHHQQAISKIQQAAPGTAGLNLQLQGGAEGQASASTSASGVRPASAEEPATSRSGNSASGAQSDNAGTSASGTQSDNASTNAQSSATNNAISATNTGTRAGGSAGGHDQRAVQMAQQIKQQCLNLTQQELAEKQGVEFDKAYIGQQVAAHINMLAELRGSRNFASSELQPVIDEGEQMTQQHLEQAKQIMSQLKDQQGSQSPQTSRRPATTQPTR